MKIYLIASGGSGAKVAEALIHLCGAGLGPDSLQILSVDTDDNNGNRSRLVSTHTDYLGCRKYKWSQGGAPVSGVSVPFSTDITLQKLSALTPVSEWGLRDGNICPEEYGDVLDLFFTQDEQETKCERGYLARPNLGSLIMGKHLSDQLDKESANPSSFLSSLRNDLNAGTEIRLVVVGSVFGGTGASVLPVASDSILKALLSRQNTAAVTAIQNSWNVIHKSAVMLMPYFFPTNPPQQEEETVDPSRFHADTSNSLSHYHSSGIAGEYNNLYLIGADGSGQQKLAFCDGSIGQRNAPSVVELIAALGCLDTPTADTPIRILNPAEHAEFIKLDNLPWPGGDRGATDFSLFLHMAAFTVRNRESSMDRGILQFLNGKDYAKEIPFWPWAAEFLKDGNGKTISRDPSLARRELYSYFLRLLLWAFEISFSRDDLSLIEWSKSNDGLMYWDVLCAAKKSAGIPDMVEDSTLDNPHPLAITMAVACASALRSTHKDRKLNGPKLLTSSLSKVSVSKDPILCKLPFGIDDFAAAEKSAGLKLSQEYAQN